MTQALERVSSLTSGETIDEFTIKDFLGEGLSKSAHTYTADPDNVVLKLYTQEINNHPFSQVRYEKFKNEPVLLKKLKDSPYVVKVLTDFREEAVHQDVKKLSPYYAMERMDGSLEGLLTSNKITLAQRLDIAIQVVQGVIDCHSKQVCHRDIYSPNVLYRFKGVEIECKITDFGSGKQKGNQQLSPYFKPMGNMTVTSPEGMVGLLGGEDAEFAIMQAADVFSVGLLLYEILTGLRQEGLNHALFGLSHIATGLKLYEPTTTHQERKKILKEVILPPLAAVKIESLTGGAILITEEVANDLDELVKSVLELDYEKRNLDLNEVLTRLKRISEGLS